MPHHYVRIEKCIECDFPTKERYKPIPDGRGTIALCRKCQKLIPKEKHPMQEFFDEEERIEKRRIVSRRKD